MRRRRNLLPYQCNLFRTSPQPSCLKSDPISTFLICCDLGELFEVNVHAEFQVAFSTAQTWLCVSCVRYILRVAGDDGSASPNVCDLTVAAYFQDSDLGMLVDGSWARWVCLVGRMCSKRCSRQSCCPGPGFGGRSRSRSISKIKSPPI
jgi:hypothetical protein